MVSGTLAGNPNFRTGGLPFGTMGPDPANSVPLKGDEMSKLVKEGALHFLTGDLKQAGI